MNYLKIAISSCRLFVEQLHSQGSNVTDQWILDFVLDHGRPAYPSGEIADLSKLDEIAIRASELGLKLVSADKDSVEGAIGGDVYEALAELSFEVLDDPEFWQFLAVKYFSRFILWRESKAASSESSEKLLTYFSGNRNFEMIPLRLYLRGAISKVGNSYELADLLETSTDFWRSHIIRVTTGTATNLSQDLVRHQDQFQMSTGKLREFAKILNRQWTNVELYYLESGESQELLHQIQAIVDSASEMEAEAEASLEEISESLERTIEDHPEETGKGRATESRAREFDLLFGLLELPKKLRDLISLKPDGARQEFEGIVFEYGNISRIEPFIEIGNPITSFKVEPKYAFHVDNLKSERKLEIQEEFDLVDGAISGRDTKVDLLLIDSSYKPFYISFKDADSQAKLGQVSTPTTYLNGKLEGGIGPIKIEARVPEVFVAAEINLNDAQLKKLRPRDKSFAYFKSKYPDEWDEYCRTRLQEAMQQVINLGDLMTQDKHEFIHFFGKSLAGNLLGDQDFYLLVGEQVVHFETFMERLRGTDFKISTTIHKPREKESLIINLEIGNEKYCVTKIEPSFEGSSIAAEQTKGIIFHLQQHQKDGNNYKKLLLDISK